MLITNMLLPTRQIQPSHSSITKIQAGKQMFANFKLIILIMGLTVQSIHNSQLRFQTPPRMQLLPKRNKKQKLKLKQKLRCLEKALPASKLLLIKQDHGKRSTKPLTKFQILKFHNHMILAILTDIISWDRLETKDHVVHAILSHSLKSLSPDLSLNMVKRSINSPHSSS